MNAAKLVWDALLADGREAVRTADIAVLARRIGKDPGAVTTTLVRSGRLLPLFKGHYYVRGHGELGLSPPRHGALELFAVAAAAKGIGPWHFGLETALRLNRMTHEDRGLDFVISSSLFRPAGVKVGLRRFVILRWAPAFLEFGLVRRGSLAWSGPEKTVLDLAFHEGNLEARGGSPPGLWREHVDAVDRRKLRRLAAHYPPRVAKEVGA
jgi:hypothetical protein